MIRLSALFLPVHKARHNAVEYIVLNYDFLSKKQFRISAKFLPVLKRRYDQWRCVFSSWRTDSEGSILVFSREVIIGAFVLVQKKDFM